MRITFQSLVFSASLLLSSSIALSAECTPSSHKLGVSREITLDTARGPHLGSFQYKQTIALKPGEVILSFDDGPHPIQTPYVLKALKAHCTKATFFVVGTMVRAYPSIFRQTIADGHSIGSHSWQHNNLQQKSAPVALRDIEKSFAILTRVAQKPIAPFFRFPYLRDNKGLRNYFAKRNIAVISVDVISGDTATFSAKTIIKNSISRLKAKGKGVLLLHDLKKATARALPTLLNQLKKNGFKIVHLVPRSNFKPADFLNVKLPQKSKTPLKAAVKPEKKKRKKTRKRRLRRQADDPTKWYDNTLG